MKKGLMVGHMWKIYRSYFATLLYGFLTTAKKAAKLDYQFKPNCFVLAKSTKIATFSLNSGKYINRTSPEFNVWWSKLSTL